MKLLTKLTVAGALVGALAAPLAAPAAVQAKPLQLTPKQKLHRVQPHKLPTHLTQRCLMPRVSIGREVRRLRHSGFYRVRFLGRKVFRPRCAQFLYFSACKRRIKYRVIVRYIKFRRFVIVQRVGHCLPFNPAPRPRLKRPGA